MDLAPERQLAHAQVLRVKGGALPPGELPAEVILDSWSRCLRSGLDFASRVPVAVIEAHGLAQRRERAAVVRQLARAELETLRSRSRAPTSCSRSRTRTASSWTWSPTTASS